MPNEECTLRNMLDLSDRVQVSKAREARVRYLDDLEPKRAATDQHVATERTKGLSDEEIGRRLVDKRNADRVASYADNPDGLAKMKDRNAERYDGREDDPDYDFLRTEQTSSTRASFLQDSLCVRRGDYHAAPCRSECRAAFRLCLARSSRRPRNASEAKMWGAANSPCRKAMRPSR